MASQVSAGCIDEEALTLVSTSGAAAAKLRQIKPRLLQLLRRDERELNSIKIVVQVCTNPNPLPKKRIFLGPTARKALLTLSSRLESPSLRSAVMALARRNADLNCKQETLVDEDPYKNQNDGETNT